METLALASSKPLLRFDSSPSISTRTLLPPPLLFRRLSKLPNSRLTVRANNSSHGHGTGLRVSIDANSKLRAQVFASVFSSIGRGGRETSSVAVPPQIAVPPPSYQFGSPLFWIGVGVGFSALFSWLASYMKNYAMQQAFKAMKEQMGSQNSQSGTSPFSSGTPFPFPPPSTVGGATSPGSPFPFPFPPPVTTTTSGPASTPRATISESTVTVDATKIEAAPATDVKVDEEVKSEPKRIAFEDVSPDEGLPKSPFEKFEVSSTSTTSKDVKFAEVVPDNGAATSGASASNESWSSTGNAGSFMTVEALEKMMEDPTVQQMVYPHLPEEMRNPATFKWMLQNPEYRKQLQDMLNNMGGGGNAQWDSRMMDNLKNFDLSSPDVKQQFDQIGLTPEEVITKIMANPEIAMAFQNPRVQAAIMDCSQNPYNITKYQNDKEVMDVFNKISELFPGVSGFP